MHLGQSGNQFAKLIIVVSLISCLNSSIGFSQATCSGIRNARDFRDCVEDAAMFQCRQSRSVDELKVCFRASAKILLGNRAPEVERLEGGPLNFECTDWFFAGLFVCALHGGEWGAPPEWCYRIDANTVNWCLGDPPNQTCKRKACPLSSCKNTIAKDGSSLFLRCGMVWNPH
jgi:hypothetical protein